MTSVDNSQPPDDSQYTESPEESPEPELNHPDHIDKESSWN